MSDLGPAIGWFDPATGKTHSLDHYKPEHANHLDSHKAGWRHAFAPEAASDTALSAKPEDGEAQAWRLIPVEITPEMVGAMAVVQASMTINGKSTLGMSGAVEAFDAMVEALPAAPSVADIVAAMSDEDRITLFSDYCLSCGSEDPDCQCWNDE